jgi:type II secretory pathway pseudopilin PulG
MSSYPLSFDMLKEQSTTSGFTLIEFLLGGLVLAIAITAILGAYIGQVTLNEHARNLSLAVQDANRVIEQMRQDTVTCPNPLDMLDNTIWNTWLQGVVGGGKSIGTPNNNDANEHVAVVYQTSAGGANPALTDNPIRVTVAVCWRHRNRTIGECDWNPGTGLFVVPEVDDNGNGVIDSPAMLTTLITCRGS